MFMYVFVDASCLYYNQFSAQLYSLLLSKCCLNREGDAANVIQSKRTGIFIIKISRYRSSKFVGNFMGNVVAGVCSAIEGVDGNDSVSGKEMNVTDEISIGSLFKFFFTSGECLCHPMRKKLC